MYLFIEENSNCSSDERVFSTIGDPRPVKAALIETPDGATAWCDVTGVAENGQFEPARAVQCEDSSAGTTWLLFGGDHGVRFRRTEAPAAWNLADKSQWGGPFLVLDAGTPLRFS